LIFFFFFFFFLKKKQEIRKRINDIDYKKCKVVVSNVDSQPSNDGGIIVQVLGELINKEEQAIKFAQTFFLAVQEGGYYVLNDIFRHLKDEVNEDYDEAMQQVEEEKEEVKNEPVKVEEPPKKTEKVEVKETKPAPPVEEPKPAPVKEKKTVAEAAASKPQTATQKTAPAKEPAPAKEASKEKEIVNEAPKPTAAKVAAAVAESKPAAVPSRPITYSSIASSSAKSWSKVAQGDGTKPAAVVVKQAAAASTPQKHQENRNNNNNNNNNNNSGNNQDKDSHTVFIKLPFTVAKEEISNALSKFGDIKNIEINGQKVNIHKYIYII